MTDRGLHFVADAPRRLTESFGAMAMLRLQTVLLLEARTSDIGEMEQADEAQADEAHVAADGDLLYVGLARGGTRLGPVEIPMVLAMFGIEGISGWLKGAFGTVVTHPDPGTLKTAFRRRPN